MAVVVAPFMISAYIIGLPYGPTGVAFAYSTVMVLWVVPAIAWAIHRTMISYLDVFLAVGRPLASSIVAGAVAFGVRLAIGQQLPPLPRLVVESTVLAVIFAVMLLFVMGQKSLYLDLLRASK